MLRLKAAFWRECPLKLDPQPEAGGHRISEFDAPQAGRRRQHHQLVSGGQHQFRRRQKNGLEVAGPAQGYASHAIAILQPGDIQTAEIVPLLKAVAHDQQVGALQLQHSLHPLPKGGGYHRIGDEVDGGNHRQSTQQLP